MHAWPYNRLVDWPDKPGHFLAAPITVLAFLIAGTALGAAEPVDPTEGPVEVVGSVSGYTVDSVRNHSINAYWIVGKSSLVQIDAYWRLPEARRALDYLSSTSDLPVRTILLTHPHTDHYGGLPVFADAYPGVSILADPVSARVIANDEQGFAANRLEDFGEDFPLSLPAIETWPDGGLNLELDGVDLEVHAFRSNEAVITSLFYLPSDGALFTGDFVNNQTTPVLYQGAIDGWIDQLQQARVYFEDATTIYPGHGSPGPAHELIEAQIAYLSFFRDAVQTALADDGAVSETETDRIIALMEDQFPDWRTSAGVARRADLIRLNIGWTLTGWRVRQSGATPSEFRPQSNRN